MVEIAAVAIVVWLVIGYFSSLKDDKHQEDLELDRWMREALDKENPVEERSEPIPNDDGVIMGLRKKISNTMLAQQYILTPEWDMKRKSVLARDKYTCQRCGAQNTQLSVHHITYKNHFKEESKDLITVCQACHQSLHDTYGYPDYDDKQDLITRYYYDI